MVQKEAQAVQKGAKKGERERYSISHNTRAVRSLVTLSHAFVTKRNAHLRLRRPSPHFRIQTWFLLRSTTKAISRRTSLSSLLAERG